ncbi:hypothetical protein Q7P37_009688 [Cladosporium fusiforme]
MESLSLPLFIALAVAVGLWTLASLWTIGKRPSTLPPGPPTLPIIGNLHQIPRKDAHLQFQAWAREYGPVYSLILGTKVMIVLSSPEAVRDLLDRRSAIYSDRIDAYVGATLASRDQKILTMRYGTQWRAARKAFHSMLHVNVAKSYVPYQCLESKQMLCEILDDPVNFQHALQRYTNSLTTQMSYGWRTPTYQDPKMKLLYESCEKYCELNHTGFAALADFFPVLRLLPGFLVPTKADANHLYEEQKHLFLGHWNDVKKSMHAGTSNPCMAVDLARLQEKERFSDEEAAFLVGNGLEAGSDTTASAMYTFVQATILFPEVQQKARAQIDMVCGNRLPDMSDFDQLPYIQCTAKETLRWLPVAILGGVPHAVTEDDHYQNYLIPKGAGVLNNVYTICSDPVRYPQPRSFEPGRYKNDLHTLAETATHPDLDTRDLFTFGAGRRICQGMHVVERSLFLSMSRLLWAFEFSAIPGKEPDPSAIVQGLVCAPARYECDITPREGKAELTRKIWDEAQSLLDDQGQWKELPRE